MSFTPATVLASLAAVVVAVLLAYTAFIAWGRRQDGYKAGQRSGSPGVMAELRHDEDSIAHIDADVPRTFPEEDCFGAMRRTGALRRVLIGASEGCSTGYVQGMNEVAAALLLGRRRRRAEAEEEEEEAEAVQLLLRLLEEPPHLLLRVLMTDTLTLCSHFDRFLEARLPETSARLREHGVSAVYYCDWFKTVFLHVAPLEEALPIFEGFMQDGWAPVYGTALRIFERLSPELAEAASFSDCVAAIRGFRHDPAVGTDGWAVGTAAEGLRCNVRSEECLWSADAE